MLKMQLHLKRWSFRKHLDIKNKLLNDFNTPFERLDEIYNSAINQFVNIITARIGEIKINPALVNWMLKHRLSLNDGLLINSAQRLELPFVTSERKAVEWKKAYEGIISQDEFWRKIKKI